MSGKGGNRIQGSHSKLWVTSLVLVVALSCTQAIEREQTQDRVLTYAAILQNSLEADTLQPFFLKFPDGTPYPVTIADEVLSTQKEKPVIEKFGHPVAFISKATADSAGLDSYLWVIDYVRSGNEARIQLLDPVRKILFGASYERAGTGWQAVSYYLEQEE